MSIPETRAEALTHLLSLLRVEEARWANAVNNAQVWGNPQPASVLLGQGYLCRSGNMALLVRTVPGGHELVPVGLEPHLSGFSLLTRADAERVAAAHPGSYRVEHIADTARTRLEEVRETLAAVLNMSAEASA